MVSASDTILVLGDSISARYGIATGNGWVDLLAAKLKAHPCQCDVINASVSGETTDGGLRRLPELLDEYTPSIVIIELGGNDGLRGFPLSVTRGNLLEMVKLSKHSNARVLLLGMQIPPNYGPRYTEGFRNIFEQLAAEHELALVPFLLDGIATDAALMQADGIHPNDEAQPLLLSNVYPTLESMIRVQTATGSGQGD